MKTIQNIADNLPRDDISYMDKKFIFPKGPASIPNHLAAKLDMNDIDCLYKSSKNFLLKKVNQIQNDTLDFYMSNNNNNRHENTNNNNIIRVLNHHELYTNNQINNPVQMDYPSSVQESIAKAKSKIPFLHGKITDDFQTYKADDNTQSLTPSTANNTGIESFTFENLSIVPPIEPKSKKNSSEFIKRSPNENTNTLPLTNTPFTKVKRRYSEMSNYENIPLNKKYLRSRTWPKLLLLKRNEVEKCGNEQNFIKNTLENISMNRCFSQEYIIIEQIGQGSYGFVSKCQKKLDSTIYAIKKTKRKINNRNFINTLNEALNLSKITCKSDINNEDNHSNIIRYYNSWIEDEYLYLVMEYCPKNLKQISKNKLSENEIIKILRDVCNGLNFMHENQMVHLDIKPENILYSTSGQYKLGDLGQSKISTNIYNSDDIIEGDGRYLASELLTNSNEKINFEKVDIYALGAMFYELIIGIDLSTDDNEKMRMRECDFEILEKVDYSQNLKEIIKKMIDLNPNKRPTTQEIMIMLLGLPLDCESKSYRKINHQN